MVIEIIKCPKYHNRKAIIRLLNNLKWKPKSNSTILIKPNLCAIRPKNVCEITDAILVEALCGYLAELNCNVLIGETNNLGPLDKKHSYEDIITNSGYAYLERLVNVSIVDLEKGPTVSKKIDGINLKIPKIVFEVDYYINFAKLKTHFVTGVSLCTKNQMGIVPQVERMRYHREGINKNISALAKALQPDLCIIDGIVGMEGKGPHWGKDKHSSLLIAGTDMAEIDAVTCKIIGIGPESVEHLEEINISKHESLMKEYCTPFKPSEKVTFQWGKISVYLQNGNPCNCCGRAVESLKRVRKPSLLFKLLYRYFFKKTVIIIGRINPKLVDIDLSDADVFCIGHCTTKFAKKNKFKYIDNCPPSRKEVINLILK